MISIQEAIKCIEEQPVARKEITLPLIAAPGFQLAEDIIAPFDVPAFDNTAIDGYAVRGNSEHYRLSGTVAAGDTGEHVLQEGEATRIFTGGQLPHHTTALIMQEHVRVQGDQLFPLRNITSGQYIRKQGGELNKGDTAFYAGHTITPAALGFIASLGYTSVRLYNKPTVSVIATGNELLQPGEKWVKGKIYESSCLSLAAALSNYGFGIHETAQLKDDPELIREKAIAFNAGADVLLFTGGVSVGDYDYVRPALEKAGATELFYKVNQKPGKPLYFGRLNDRFVFGLPGNPASALTFFYIYVLPLLQRISGNAGSGLTRLRLPLQHEFRFESDRPSFLKAQVRNGLVEILQGQQSAMIHSYASANALVMMEKPEKLAKGALVQTILL